MPPLVTDPDLHMARALFQIPCVHGLLHLLDPPIAAPSAHLQVYPQASSQVVE